MKYIINESQHKYIISEINQETIKTISHRWFKKQIEKGEDPHIEGSLLMFLGIKKYTTLHVDLLRELRHFLGDGAYEASISRGNKVYDTSDFPEISGGYDFNFEVKIGNEKSFLIFSKKIQHWRKLFVCLLKNGIK